MSKQIEIGDIVDVYFSDSPRLLNLEVLYIPCATGDCFKMKDPYGGLYNIQHYDYMFKRAREEEGE